MPGMALSAESLVWLHDTLGRDVEEDDLARTYAFDHPLNAGRRLEAQQVDVPRNSFSWEVEFDDGEGTSLLEEPLARKVARADRLIGNAGPGIVAFNEVFRIRRDARGQGFGTALHEAECALYARWGVREIHIDAEDDGLTFWPRRGFEPVEPGLLSRRYKRWAEENGVAGPSPSSAAEYPPSFLSALRWLPLYKVIA